MTSRDRNPLEALFVTTTNPNLAANLADQLGDRVMSLEPRVPFPPAWVLSKNYDAAYDDEATLSLACYAAKYLADPTTQEELWNRAPHALRCVLAASEYIDPELRLRWLAAADQDSNLHTELSQTVRSHRPEILVDHVLEVLPHYSPEDYATIRATAYHRGMTPALAETVLRACARRGVLWPISDVLRDKVGAHNDPNYNRVRSSWGNSTLSCTTIPLSELLILAQEAGVRELDEKFYLADILRDLSFPQCLSAKDVVALLAAGDIYADAYPNQFEEPQWFFSAEAVDVALTHERFYPIVYHNVLSERQFDAVLATWDFSDVQHLRAAQTQATSLSRLKKILARVTSISEFYATPADWLRHVARPTKPLLEKVFMISHNIEPYLVNGMLLGNRVLRPTRAETRAILDRYWCNPARLLESISSDTDPDQIRYLLLSVPGFAFHVLRSEPSPASPELAKILDPEPLHVTLRVFTYLEDENRTLDEVLHTIHRAARSDLVAATS